MKFIGRKKELEILRNLIQKQSASMVVIKGRRRIGKSRLIQEFGKNLRTYFFSGLPPTAETTTQSQIDEFSRQLSENFGLPKLPFTDWGDVFSLLSNQVQQGKVLIVFDEISWIGHKDPDFLGKIKNMWDKQLSKNAELIVILCGSVSAWIEKNILKSTGFVGRISVSMTLEELSLSDCNAFLGTSAQQISSFEKFKLFSVTGGIPKYLEEIQPQITAEQNIKNLCFLSTGYLFHEFDQIFSDVFLTRSEFYKKTMMLLVNQKMTPKEICDEIGVELSNTTSDYFEELTQAGFIKRDYTWHLKTQTASKLSHYRLKDNYTRFYLKYILPNKHRIETGSFNDKSLSELPDWNTIMGLQFENLVLNNRKKIWELLQIHPSEIVWDNPFFQNKTSKQPGCQIDYLIQTKYSNLYVCEIKFSRFDLKPDIIPEVEKKINLLQRPKGFSCRPVLIHVNGVHETIIDQQYFAKIIDFGDLLTD
jgi:AAA+ ATPase superfamily predicted ATPase